MTIVPAVVFVLLFGWVLLAGLPWIGRGER